MASVSRTLILLFLLAGCAQEKGHAPGAVFKLDQTKPCGGRGDCLIYVTQATATGNMSGIAGADSLCNSDSAKPNNGTYKAVLTSSTRRACNTYECSAEGAAENIDWALYPNKRYFREDGTYIGTTNSAGIMLEKSGRLSEEDLFYWTGTYAGWEPSGDMDFCQNWTNAAANRATSFGVTYEENFVINGSASCADLLNIVCAEQ